MKELVLARFNESIEWVPRLASTLPCRCSITIYNKGDPLPSGPWTENVLDNVGREAETYLRHIVSRWSTLSDWTVFCQADPLPHVLGGVEMIAKLLSADETSGFLPPTTTKVNREWGPDGRLNWRHWIGWNDKIGRVIHPAELSFTDYVQQHLGVDLLMRKGFLYSPGAIFGVSKEAIKRRSRSFYEGLMETVSHHVHPEEAHYLERMWGMMFGGEGWMGIVEKQPIGVELAEEARRWDAREIKPTDPGWEFVPHGGRE